MNINEPREFGIAAYWMPKLVAEARAWLLNTFPAASDAKRFNRAHDSLIRAYMDVSYLGGWEGFVEDMGDDSCPCARFQSHVVKYVPTGADAEQCDGIDAQTDRKCGLWAGHGGLHNSNY